MDIALAVWAAGLGDVRDIVRASTVSTRWHRSLTAQAPFQARFGREFRPEYALLCAEQEAIALVQDWRTLYIQRSLGFANGFRLGMDLLPAPEDPIELAQRKAEASLLRWIYVTEQAEVRLSRPIFGDVLEAASLERLPLQEALHWQHCFSQAKPLYDQLLHPAIPAACDVLDDADYAFKIDEQAACIKKLYNQAVWNVKYFKVLEKPFRDLLTSDVKQIGTIVPAIIKTLKMMWSSSKYYKDSAKMGSLLGRIALALCARVSATVEINHLLCGNDFDATISLVESAGMMLERWHDVYTENDGGFWGPFDRTELFGRVDDVAQWCSEVRSVLMILRQIKLEMVRRADDVETFEAMLSTMDAGLYAHWATVVLFDASSRASWLDGVGFLRATSNALLAFAHKLGS
ncbi:hypothetical protein SPRG_20330 [Saprolegnia parasitica CBS 223.65]|uniref:Dynein heavy chain tail domain-containing protein n=1 Tax=Saprolegnia parasitica (strain CBS 223.65) TaxID=695850 RepID=A0A067CAB7_SAPPC|nr:hypothetical protein SPRG_20330 [Saprolegnia parasitica CBS 223.65]KDO27453.1 hypothetical protein SPRG_20330 [Saprolegnia parasitica CBS 223.65]|eukprot:XP_012201943.1 hypothetical protein SPRG_20330 [Saprolegnia parasitica CBS 223.65]